MKNTYLNIEESLNNKYIMTILGLEIAVIVFRG